MYKVLSTGDQTQTRLLFWKQKCSFSYGPLEELALGWPSSHPGIQVQYLGDSLLFCKWDFLVGM